MYIGDGEAREQVEVAPVYKMQVQMRGLRSQDVAGDGIYKLDQTCIGQSSGSRSILSPPAFLLSDKNTKNVCYSNMRVVRSNC